MSKRKPKDPNKYPRGWDAKKVRALAAFYEKQSDAGAAAEDDAAYADGTFTMMAVPHALVAKVQKLIAKLAG
jgi:hypothetical protein